MIEIYLFVNPIGNICYRTEQNILNLIEESKRDITFRFIPLLSLNTIDNILDRESLSKNDLNLRNTLSREVYRASLDYKAALFQGQKRGRLFLLNVQDQIKNNAQYHYTEEIAQQAAIAARLDLELFNEDCNSELAIKAFKQDQKLAAEMKVTQHPSVVIFDPSNEKTAFSISGPDSMTFLDNVLTTQFCNHGETNVVAEKKALEQIQYSKKNSSHPLRLR